MLQVIRWANTMAVLQATAASFRAAGVERMTLQRNEAFPFKSFVQTTWRLRSKKRLRPGPAIAECRLCEKL